MRPQARRLTEERNRREEVEQLRAEITQQVYERAAAEMFDAFERVLGQLDLSASDRSRYPVLMRAELVKFTGDAEQGGA